MIWCLHGFMGAGTDWDRFDADFHALGFNTVHKPDLFQTPPDSRDPATWGTDFAARVAAEDTSPVLLAYSLGGRLGLHACLARPDLWKAAIIVATHPGLATAEERATRRHGDEAWAARFTTEDEATLLDDWNTKAVFGNRPPSRPPRQLPRAALASALRIWSLGRQEHLTDRLATLPFPILWLAGAADEKFTRLAREVEPHLRHGTVHIVPEAAHRVPWEAPATFMSEIKTFLTPLLKDREG